MKYFRAGLLSLLGLAAPLLASIELTQHETATGFFSPALENINKYDLLLTVGMDEDLDQSAIQFGIGGFTEMGWDQAKIDQFRLAAVHWFRDRYGIDFTYGYYDSDSGVIATDIALLVPVSYSGKSRVLSSNNFKILPYSFLTPTVIKTAIYVVAFTGAPFNYGGTYANGETIQGNPSDGLNYSVHRIFLNKSETKHETFFLRNYYPNTTEPTPGVAFPNPVTERMQIFSPTFGPGFASASSSVSTVPNAEGKYPTHVRASWSFPGSFTIPEWNGFTEAPVEL